MWVGATRWTAEEASSISGISVFQRLFNVNGLGGASSLHSFKLRFTRARHDRARDTADNSCFEISAQITRTLSSRLPCVWFLGRPKVCITFRSSTTSPSASSDHSPRRWSNALSCSGLSFPTHILLALIPNVGRLLLPLGGSSLRLVSPAPCSRVIISRPCEVVLQILL